MKFSARDLLYIIDTGKIKEIYEYIEKDLVDIEMYWNDEIYNDEESKKVSVKMLLLYQASIKFYNEYTPSKKPIREFHLIQKLCDELGWVYEEEINI